MSVKSGKCIKTGALIKVLEYGLCQRGDVFLVGDCIVINLGASLYEGTRTEEPTGHEVILGFKGFYHDKKHMIVVPVEQFRGEVYPDGPEPVMFPVAAVTSEERIKELTAEIERLEKLRPHWAKGYTSDGVAAQVNLSATMQLWGILGVNDQTAAVTKLRELMDPVRAVVDISGGALHGVWCERPAKVLFVSSDADEVARHEADHGAEALLDNFNEEQRSEASWLQEAKGGAIETKLVEHYFGQVASE